MTNLKKCLFRTSLWSILIVFLFLSYAGAEDEQVTPVSLKKQKEELTFASQGITYIKYKKEVGGEVKNKVEVDYSDVYELIVKDKTLEGFSGISRPGTEGVSGKQTWYQIEINVKYYDKAKKKKKIKFIFNVSGLEVGKNLRNKLLEIVPISLIPKHNLDEKKKDFSGIQSLPQCDR